MEHIGSLLVVLAFIAAIYSLVRICLRMDSTFVLHSIVALSLFAGFCALGFAAMWTLAKPPALPARAFAATTFMLSRIGLGSLWLTRSGPKLQMLPKWIAQPSGIDIALGIIVVLTGGYLALN